MAVTEETEAQVRADREAAVERADRIANGEEPWLEEESQNPDDNEVAVKNEDVGETTSDAPAFEEVDEIPEPTE